MNIVDNMPLESLLAIVEKEYRIHVERYEMLVSDAERLVVKLLTDRGDKVLKRWRRGSSVLNYVLPIYYEAAKYINIAELIPTAEGHHYIKVGKRPYLLYNYIEATGVKRSNRLDVMRSCAVLAHFHKVCQNKDFPILSKRDRYHKLSDKFTRFRSDVMTCLRAVSELGGEAERIYKKYVLDYLQEVKNCENNVLELERLELLGRSRRQIAHGDSGLRNFLSDGSKAYMIDIESFEHNISITDLIKFVEAVQLSLELIPDVISTYQMASGCNNLEIRVALRLLKLPGEFPSYIKKYLKTEERVYLEYLRNFCEFDKRRRQCLTTLLLKYSGE